VAATAEAHPQSPRRPPPLPSRLLALGPVVHIITGAWFLAAVILLIADSVPRVWLWTAVSGTALGMVGVLLILWQRRAAIRGAKGAQKVS
jgi:membrane associated rhomboid family serine protease